MAGLDETNRPILESYLGPIEPGEGFGEEADLELRIERLTYPALVALEILLGRQAEMMQVAGSYSADNVRSSHQKNLDLIGPHIQGLAVAIRNDSDITLDDSTEALVARAEGPTGVGARTFETTVNRNRRG